MSRAGGRIPGGACVKSGASGLRRTGRRGKGNRFDGAGSLGTGSSIGLGTLSRKTELQTRGRLPLPILSTSQAGTSRSGRFPLPSWPSNSTLSRVLVGLTPTLSRAGRQAVGCKLPSHLLDPRSFVIKRSYMAKAGSTGIPRMLDS